MKRFKWDKKYLYGGITSFCVICLAIVFYKGLDSISSISSFLSYLMNILTPFVWGIAIAYILNPLMCAYQRLLFVPIFARFFKNSGKKDKRCEKWGRSCALFLAEITLLLIVAAMIWMVVPQLVVSVKSIIMSSSSYATVVYGWIEMFLSDYPDIEAFITDAYGSLSVSLIDWLTNSLLPEMTSIMTNVTNGVFYVLRGLYNFLIGIIVSVYVLSSKETFAGYAKKILYCIFTLEVTKKILAAFRFTDSVFMGFISGKILDSAIIGVMCYVACQIMGMPHVLLVSVVVGVTNIIPFFGPFIGAVPCAIIILMVSPFHCLLFIIFIFLLQQFDGNFLGPKILGDAVGISGFWVLFSILVGAGLFGFMGMLLGVPVFVVIYSGIKVVVEKKLERSGLPVETAEYHFLAHIDPESMECIEIDKSAKKNSRRKKRKAAPPESESRQSDETKNGAIAPAATEPDDNAEIENEAEE